MLLIAGGRTQNLALTAQGLVVLEHEVHGSSTSSFRTRSARSHGHTVAARWRARFRREEGTFSPFRNAFPSKLTTCP